MKMDRSRIAALNAIDLALESQRMDAELDEFVGHLLPLLDHVEKLCRGLNAAPAEAVVNRREAISLLPEIADRAAGSIGLERLGVPGEAAQPEIHEVVDIQRSAGHAHGTVLDVVQFGWRFRGRILRSAKVIAASDNKA